MSKFSIGQIGDTKFDELFFKAEFDSVTEVWDQRFSGSDFLITQNGRYVMKHTTASGITTSIPKLDNVFSSASVSAEMLIKKTKNKKNSGGLILWANSSGSAAIFVEFNYKGRLRLKQINGVQETILTPAQNEGWVKVKGFKKGKINLMEARCEASAFDICLNGRPVFSKELYQSYEGRMGLFTGSNSEIEVESFKIHLVKGTDVRPEYNKNPDGSFEEILLLFRNKIETQQREIQTLQNELNMCRNTAGVDTSARKQNTDLMSKNQELMKRITALEDELTEKTRRLEFLESMKADLEKSSNGDLIINLTQLLAAEKNENAELKKDLTKAKERNADLKTKIQELKLKISELEKQ
jgi:hypothetical protein